VVPARPVRRRFLVRMGRCRGCPRRVQGCNPLQTSDALGKTASQLGPNALSLAAHLHGFNAVLREGRATIGSAVQEAAPVRGRLLVLRVSEGDRVA
jgi:hypothetical protein